MRWYHVTLWALGSAVRVQVAERLGTPPNLSEIAERFPGGHLLTMDCDGAFVDAIKTKTAKGAKRAIA